METVRLRPPADADEEPLFAMMRDPDAVRMAAFTAPDPSDREAFASHFARIRSNAANRTFAIDVDGAVAGMVAAYLLLG